MVYKTCGDTIAVRLEKGEEIVSSIRAICGQSRHHPGPWRR